MKQMLMSQLAVQIRGVSYKPDDLHKGLDENSIALLRANNINDGEINFNDLVYVDRSKVSNNQLLRQGDILICASSGSKNLVGKAAQVDFNREITFGAFCKVVRPTTVESDYLGMYFQSPIYRKIVSSLAQGANINNIKNADIDNLLVNIPNNDTKKKIVEIFKRMQSIIRNRQQQLQKLDELVKARFVELFGDPISNPMNWNKRTLKEVCTKLNDGTHFSPESFSMGDYKYITAKNIKASGFDFSNITYVPEAVHRPIFERCNPEQGDVLYIKDGATTGIAIVNTLKEEFTLLSSVALLKQNRNVINGYFLAALLNNADMYSDIRNNMGGAAITRLTIAKLNAVKVIVPPLDLQNRFAAFVEQVDKSKVAVQKSLDEAQLLFDSLMQQYFG